MVTCFQTMVKFKNVWDEHHLWSGMCFLAILIPRQEVGLETELSSFWKFVAILWWDTIQLAEFYLSVPY